jgi:ribosomal protein RSM22 (predicted rRNA methylase)
VAWEAVATAFLTVAIEQGIPQGHAFIFRHRRHPVAQHGDEGVRFRIHLTVPPIHRKPFFPLRHDALPGVWCCDHA